jgi:hypothetical protein
VGSRIRGLFASTLGKVEDERGGAGKEWVHGRRGFKGKGRDRKAGGGRGSRVRTLKRGGKGKELA